MEGVGEPGLRSCRCTEFCTVPPSGVVRTAVGIASIAVGVGIAAAVAEMMIVALVVIVALAVIVASVVIVASAVIVALTVIVALAVIVASTVPAALLAILTALLLDVLALAASAASLH